MTVPGKILPLILFALIVSVGPAVAGDKNKEAGSEVLTAMHHMQIMINHAVGMAAEGANLIVLGARGTTPGIDRVSIEQGGKLLEDAETMVFRVMSGEEMKDLHSRMFGSKEVSTMVATHDLAKAAMAYIDQLKKMASASEPQENPNQ